MLTDTVFSVKELSCLPILTDAEFNKAMKEKRVLDLGVSDDPSVIKIVKMTHRLSSQKGINKSISYFDINPQDPWEGEKICQLYNSEVFSDFWKNSQGHACIIAYNYPGDLWIMWPNDRSHKLTKDTEKGRRLLASNIKDILLSRMENKNDETIKIDTYDGIQEISVNEIKCLCDMLLGKDSKKLIEKYGEVFKRFTPKPENPFVMEAIDEVRRMMSRYVDEMKKRKETFHWDTVIFKNERTLIDDDLDGEKERAKETWRSILKFMRAACVNEQMIEIIHYEMYRVYERVTHDWDEIVFPRTKEECDEA